MDDQIEMTEAPMEEPVAATPDPTPGRRALVKEIAERIRADRKHHSKAFERMKKDMQLARIGAPQDWLDGGNYTANITGRHIRNKVTALYAKNPKAIARRRERLDFALWDERVETIMEAMQLATRAMQTPPDPLTGLTPAMFDPQIQQAVALVQDYQQGMQQRDQIERVAKTLQILFDYFMSEQTPVDFKTSMKAMVRRATTTGVGYVKLGFQREYDEDPETADRLSDFTTQLRHLDLLMQQVQDNERGDIEARKHELELSMRSLQEQQFVLIREGLVFDFPESNRVIPDRLTRSLNGFVGARHLTVEYLYTRSEVQELFGVDLAKGDYARYGDDGMRYDPDEPQFELGDGDRSDQSDLVCVWEHYDRASGNVFYLVDGHPDFLREPAAPDVYVETFWPVFALTFNEVEDSDNLFPPSDVRLIEHMQLDYNRSRQGKREHRQAARPRFWSRTGALDDDKKAQLSQMRPFDVIDVDTDANDLRSVVQAIDIPGVDPNLYDTGETMSDVQLTIGAQEAAFGATSKATATEAAIADSSQLAGIESNVDDLDGLLTRVAKAAGQILLQEMSAEKVKEIAGPGAMWPEMTLDQIVKELTLEVEAGSTGKPNQALEIRNWQNMLPYLIQMPGISPVWIARESLRRLDDRMDLTDALAEGLPSIAQLNRMAQAGPQDPGAAPDQQGGEGGDKTQRPPQRPAGTDAPMGNNQV